MGGKQKPRKQTRTQPMLMLYFQKERDDKLTKYKHDAHAKDGRRSKKRQGDPTAKHLHASAQKMNIQRRARLQGGQRACTKGRTQEGTNNDHGREE